MWIAVVHPQGRDLKSLTTNVRILNPIQPYPPATTHCEASWGRIRRAVEMAVLTIEVTSLRQAMEYVHAVPRGEGHSVVIGKIWVRHTSSLGSCSASSQREVVGGWRTAGA